MIAGEPRAEKSAEKPPEKPVKLEKQDQDPLAPPESSASAWRKWRLLQDGDETRPKQKRKEMIFPTSKGA